MGPPQYVTKEEVSEPFNFSANMLVEQEGDYVIEFPGISLLFKYETFTDFDMYLLFIILLIVLIFVMSFILFLHQWKLIRFITDIIPESAILLIVGSFIGLLGNAILPSDLPTKYFFQVTIYNILIPPIILHASYDLYHQQFFHQIPSILFMAIVGTALNAALISVGLYFSYAIFFNPNINIFHILTFSSIIAAVDPVAVLAVFESVNADEGLYYLVFGEALLNDGITFVLFEGFKELALIPFGTAIPWSSYVFVVLSFLSAPFGGFICGSIAALLSAFTTKYTNEAIKHLEIIIILSFVMLSYVIASKSGWSGIIATIICGLLQVKYAFPNLHPDSKSNVVNVVKTVAVICEIFIFILLGNSFTKGGGWDWRFIGFTILFCHACRFVIIILISSFLNCFRKKKISWKWQVIIFLGGLRGAIAYAMVISYEGSFSQMFTDTTLVIIFVTVIINGIAAKPLIKSFKLQNDHTQNNNNTSSLDTANKEKSSSDSSLDGFKYLDQKIIIPLLSKKKMAQKENEIINKTLSKPDDACECVSSQL